MFYIHLKHPHDFTMLFLLWQVPQLPFLTSSLSFTLSSLFSVFHCSFFYFAYISLRFAECLCFLSSHSFSHFFLKFPSLLTCLQLVLVGGDEVSLLQILGSKISLTTLGTLFSLNIYLQKPFHLISSGF